MRGATSYSLLSSTLLFLLCGCRHTIDSIVVPINNATVDLNQTTKHIEIPATLFPGVKLQMKETKLIVEKSFRKERM